MCRLAASPAAAAAAAVMQHDIVPGDILQYNALVIMVITI